jgi:hypothetical protein
LLGVVYEVAMPTPRKKPVYVNGVKCWICSKCNQALPESSFGPDKKRPLGIRSACRVCMNADSRTYTASGKRKKRKYNKELMVNYVMDSRRRNPEKYDARCAVFNAIRRGDLVRPMACECCGEASSRIEAHHDSYAEGDALRVVWMCVPCHKWTHVEQGKQDALRASLADIDAGGD